MMRRLATVFLAAIATAAVAAPPRPYHTRAEVRSFIRDLVVRHQFVQEELEYVFARVRREATVLSAIEPKARGERRPWTAYRALFVNDRHIAHGVEFWVEHQAALARAQREFGVPAEIIVAIIGVETFYGRNMGRWRVVDALTTLAFDYPRRAEFFRDELTKFLLLARDTDMDVFSVRGSYAGAIGIPQFMPSSYLSYALDYDADGTVDLRASAADAVGSIANYLRRHGWQEGALVITPAQVNGAAFRDYADGSTEPKHTLAELANAGVTAAGVPADARAALIELDNGTAPREYRLGLPNFYVLTRYNRSTFYACAVTDLAEALRAARQPGGR